MTTALPPSYRTSLWSAVTEGAKDGKFLLQYCPACGQYQYPPREVCADCLSPSPEWRAVDGAGVVISWTTQHASLEPWFRDRLPLQIALVRLDCGPVLYSFTDTTMSSGDRVTVTAKIDASGVAVLCATKF